MSGSGQVDPTHGWRAMRSGQRLIVAVAVGVLVAVVVGLTYRWAYAPIAAWIAGALTFVIWAWRAVLPLKADETKTHALLEDPSRGDAHLILLAANVASLGAVAYVILEASDAQTLAKRAVLAAVALLSVAVSWVVVQTVYTLDYADLYYGHPQGGVDFPGHESPTYHDFAYLAFTMGMTYQVSDTNLQTSEFRRKVLGHALLSYVFGTVILATTINLVVGLSSR